MPVDVGQRDSGWIDYGQRVSLFFGALFLIYGVHLPFLPLWLEWRGLTPSEIGVVVALPYVLRLAVSPTTAYYADRGNAHAFFILILAAISLAAALALSGVTGFPAILAAAVVLSLAMTTIMPLTEVIAVRGVRLAGCDYGRMRLWGSLTFILASWIAAAAVAWFGVGSVIYMVIAATLLTTAAAIVLPGPMNDDGRSGAGRAPASNRDVVRSSATAAAALRPARVRDLISSRTFLLFLIAAGTAQAAHGTYYAFGSIHWARQGLSAPAIGGLWAVGVVAEIALFAWSGRLFERVSAVALLTAGCALSVVRWAAMAFDPGLAALVALQTLHAATFGASHLAAIRYIADSVDPALQGTAQALYATMAMGVAMGLATFVSGRVYDDLAGATYLIMAGFALSGLIAALGMRFAGDAVGRR